MAGKTDLDHQAAHKYFSAHCFNRAWDLIDKTDRTPGEDEEMIRLSLASQYHWSQREDANSKTASIGFWQTSRIYALLGQVEVPESLEGLEVGEDYILGRTTDEFDVEYVELWGLVR